VTQSFEAIHVLIREGHFDQAKSMIAAARENLPASQMHRLDALSGQLERTRGNLSEGLDLLRQAIRQAPTWLPHWYLLSVYLMDDQLWLDALEASSELISLSEQSGERYFLDDARFRKLLCLKALGRHAEIPAQKHDFAPDIAVFSGGRLYTLDDLD
jgi:tetratricopeptide (TPR) repeat protein